jgi:hypothetical protein
VKKPASDKAGQAAFIGLWAPCRDLPAIAWSQESCTAFTRQQAFFPKPADVFKFLNAWCDTIERQRSDCQAIIRFDEKRKADEAKSAEIEATRMPGARQKMLDAIEAMSLPQRPKQGRPDYPPSVPISVTPRHASPASNLAQYDDIARNSPNEGLRKAAQRRVNAMRAAVPAEAPGVSS